MITIEFVILGLLSRQPMTGYEIKKIFANSIGLYWSGNNNQIYTALVKLHKKELVTREIEVQTDRPSRKIYSITEKGLSELKNTLLTTPETPQLIHPLLIQLAWADRLDEEELDRLLGQYEEEIRMQSAMLQAQAGQPPEEARERYVNPDLARTPRETLIWAAIQERWIAFYQNELDWVQTLRKQLKE